MDNLRLNRKHIAWPHHIGPTQLIDTQADGPFGEVQCLYKQPHGYCRGMPAACNQTFKNCSLGTFTVEMKHLRIKLAGELDHLLLRYFKRFGLKTIAHFQIIEAELLHFQKHVATDESLVRIEQHVNAPRFVQPQSIAACTLTASFQCLTLNRNYKEATQCL